MKNHNVRIAKEGRAYTPGEISQLYNISTGTVYRWMKEGMEPIEKNKNPLLIYGHEIKRFLLSQKRRHKTRLKEDEFYCLKCRAAKRGDPKTFRQVKTGKKIGKMNRDQYQKVAACEDCSSTMRRFA